MKNGVGGRPSANAVIFLADMHLKPLDAATREAREIAAAENERLARFLSMVEGRARSLVLLGDAFNAWFERRGRFLGDYYAALNLFKLASERGLEIHHVSGNRDFVVGEGLGFDPSTHYPGFFRKKGGFTISRLADFGIEPHGERYRFHLGGKTISCVHGDSLCTGQKVYMAWRHAIRSRLGRVFLYRLPWALCFPISGRQSDIRVRRKHPDPGSFFGEKAIRREIATGGDMVVCGHVHAHYQVDMDVVGRKGRLVAIPAWQDGSYAVLKDGADAPEIREFA